MTILNSIQTCRNILVSGEINNYPSGGFLVPLGRTLYNMYFNVDYLFKRQWISRHTRVVTIEFLAYNANYNVFTSVTLVLERTPSGIYEKVYLVNKNCHDVANYQLSL